MELPTNCIICGAGAQHQRIPRSNRVVVDCTRCSRYEISGTALAASFPLLRSDIEKKAALSYLLRGTSRESGFFVPAAWITNALEHAVLPNASQLFENLIRIVGESTRLPGRSYESPTVVCQASVGALTDNAVADLIRWATEEGLLVGRYDGSMVNVRLTLKGWDRYQQIVKGGGAKRVNGFMAMAFNQPSVRSLYIDAFVPGAKSAGFDLATVEERPVAGAIDFKVVNEIRGSRFLIADYTGRNSNVCWEAGFAEGIGIPVIYSCEDSRANRKGLPFNTRNRRTLFWRPDQLEDASSLLTQILRFTFPEQFVPE